MRWSQCFALVLLLIFPMFIKSYALCLHTKTPNSPNGKEKSFIFDLSLNKMQRSVHFCMCSITVDYALVLFFFLSVSFAFSIILFIRSLAKELNNNISRILLMMSTTYLCVENFPPKRHERERERGAINNKRDTVQSFLWMSKVIVIIIA